MDKQLDIFEEMAADVNIRRSLDDFARELTDPLLAPGPLFTHDCHECKFLGRYAAKPINDSWMAVFKDRDETTRDIDLYIHNREFLIIRWASFQMHGTDDTSFAFKAAEVAMQAAVLPPHHPALVALGRAKKFGHY